MQSNERIQEIEGRVKDFSDRIHNQAIEACLVVMRDCYIKSKKNEDQSINNMEQCYEDVKSLMIKESEDGSVSGQDEEDEL